MKFSSWHNPIEMDSSVLILLQQLMGICKHRGVYHNSISSQLTMILSMETDKILKRKWVCNVTVARLIARRWHESFIDINLLSIPNLF